jgi:hypothetical protein
MMVDTSDAGASDGVAMFLTASMLLIIEKSCTSVLSMD